MKRVTRDRRLSAEESAKYKLVRKQVSEELPELIARHRKRQEQLPDRVSIHPSRSA